VPPVPAPLVAIVGARLAAGRVRGWKGSGFAVPEAYVAAVRRAGGRALVVAPGDDTPADELLAPFDGLLLMGGGDLDPAYYGATPHPSLYGIDRDRDEVELRLARWAIERDVPTLAICRGHQVVNVALGGSLHQHLPEMPGLIPHGAPVRDESVNHEVSLVAGSRVAKACGGELVSGVSHHHQAVDRLGEGLVVVGWSPDSVVEAVETEASDGWLVSVQWHPERTAPSDPAQQGLFDALVSAATDRSPGPA
jgi:putative glutamine amidotransferase